MSIPSPSSNLLFLGTSADVPYLPALKSIVKHTGATYVITEPTSTLIQILMYCKSKGVTGVICTQASMIPRLDSSQISGNKSSYSLDSYAGSLFSKDGIDFVFISPLEQLHTVPYGKFLAQRYISKLTSPDSWLKATDFSWEIFKEARADHLITFFSSALLIAVDIETVRTNLAITCVGYCGIFEAPNGTFFSHSIVIPCDCMYNLAYIRKFNSLPIRKVLQNGKYDIAYLMRYNAPITHYFWDTATAHHCWYSELPKDLGSLAAFYIRGARYWKDENSSTDMEAQYLYNAKDTWNTANVMLAWLLEAPAYAYANYLIEFPLLYPCILSEATGLKADLDILDKVRKVEDAKAKSMRASLAKCLGVSDFNPGSWQQVQKLLKVLGCADLKSTDEKSLNKCSDRHPLNAFLVDKILEYRGAAKLVSTYLVPEKLMQDRVLYALNPHGTDTGRLASREHHFWCGLQIQNIPSSGDIKSYMVADPGFYLAEADYSQAESRDTAYISGDTNLIQAVESSRDFHSHNASCFFGLPYEEIYRDEEYIEDGIVFKAGTINKPIRDLAKRTNHGANYNMGAAVMVDTMGRTNLLKAQALLGLPKFWSILQVAEHLLTQFAKTYPKVKKDYQEHIIYTIQLTKILVGATGWTRYCFSDPAKNKRALNSYVAHPPQSLNAMTLNKAFLAVFYNVWLPNHKNFKLCAQIHDSILFQYRKGHEHLIQEVKKCMEFPIQVTDVGGITRTFIVPTDIKSGLTSWG